jgi:hypothetical protein
LSSTTSILFTPTHPNQKDWQPIATSPNGWELENATAFLIVASSHYPHNFIALIAKSQKLFLRKR